MRDIPNIIVLVSGTTDPTNTDTRSHSASYQNTKPITDPDWYWGENPGLRKDIEALRQRYTNVHIFTAHGWSGDNGKSNRRVAGTYLANRLCGAEGQVAYYKKFLKQEVAFHFIGHSHGGNVINELTRQAAKVWPRTWKIRSVTYLSTPFFQRQHLVDTAVFHEECKIVNVHNQYDLTQRVVADFSLLPFHDALEKAGFEQVTQLLADIHFDGQLLKDAIKSTRPRDADDSWRINLKLLMSSDKAGKLYDHCIQLLEKINGIFAKLREIIRTLSKPFEFPVAIELQGKAATKRAILPELLAGRFISELDKLEKSLSPLMKALKDRKKSGKYPLDGLFDDLHVSTFLKALAQFLRVDVKTLSGPLCDLIAGILKHQIEAFDNTGTSPRAQLKATPFSASLTDVDITAADPYSQFQLEATYKRFVGRLETSEVRYDKYSTQTDLMDLIFTLVANVGLVQNLVSDWGKTVHNLRVILEWVTISLKVERFLPDTHVLSPLSPINLLREASHLASIPVVASLAELCGAVESFVTVLQERSVGKLEVTPLFSPLQPFSLNQTRLPVPNKTLEPFPRAPAKLELKPAVTYGTMDYFMRVSHSVSRQELYPKVRSVIEGQITSKKR
ncbi:hypothetical protein [Corallococcus sp. Z5C101001]|uniref:hypothetical protein n=1 Tax=Corallococcus sp. Z5C101001 TaxID=2596829 RepID=UPI00117FC8B4|nr:hypothetical protein [Corallococcus sp. Z5C101001]TSC25770.1 hypothetical protein FOF48_22420 [Corallococcus sp. Z5C101001]